MPLEWKELDLAKFIEGEATNAFMHKMLDHPDARAGTRLRLINNAGVLEPIGPAHENSPDDVLNHIAVNLSAPMALTSAFLRCTESMAADRRIMQISSGAGRKPYAGWSAYCTTKAGLDQFTRCVHLEQKTLPNGARVASVAPGVIDTAMQTLIRQADEERFPNRVRFVKLYETGGLTPPREAACRLLHLLEHPDFGKEPIVDIREWSPPTE